MFPLVAFHPVRYTLIYIPGPDLVEEDGPITEGSISGDIEYLD